MMTACPSHEELAWIGTGASAGSCPPGIDAHIEGCAQCRAFLARCVGDGLESLAIPAAELPGPDAVPPQIDGFTIERELGRGAMAVVYLARRDAPSRRVALKLLPGGRRAGRRERRHWLREAEAASLVRHPNVVGLYEVGEVDDWFLLVLEYIPGGTLADRLSVPLAPRDAARFTETIARAVHHIHRCGQLHLDLKPSNILLDGDPGAGWEAIIPKVSDFGIARMADSGATDTVSAGLGGTPSYMAPEQITRPRQELTAAADIHGLGAILYHMLTGRPPYQGTTVLETIDLVQRQDAVPPRRLNPKIPADLETICLKCLEKDPLRRYRSADLLALDLASWQDGRPISARLISPVAKGWRWCRRRPVVAALAAALTLTIAVSFFVVTLLWRQANAALGRAESNLRVSNELLTDLLDLSVGGENGYPKVMTLDRLIPLLEKDRKRLLALSEDRPDDVLVVHQLAVVENRLCECLLQAKRMEDARSVLLESLAKLNVLVERHPVNRTVHSVRATRFRLLAEVSEGMGNATESVSYLSRAVQVLEEEIRIAPSAIGLHLLHDTRRGLAWLVASQGDHERARSLIEANGRLVENPPPECASANRVVLRLENHIDSQLFINGFRRDTSCSTESSAVDGSAPLSGLRSPTDASQSPGDWAKVAALALRSTRNCDPATQARSESENALNVMRYLAKIASRLNRAGDLQSARLIGERMNALANALVESYPNEPAAHLAESLAFVQLYKNAWRTKDQAAVEVNMKLALDQAEEARLLDPTSEIAQQAVYSVQRRLADLRSK
jgi:eukaryotic-like serine/threonine-protein kinase